MVIAGFVLVGLTFDELRVLNPCNSNTCISDENYHAYCYAGDCIRTPRIAVCIDGNCNRTQAANFNIDTLHVNNMLSTGNSTAGIIINDIAFKNKTIASVCMVTDGACNGTLGPSKIDTILANRVFSLDGERCLLIGDNEAIAVCSNNTVNINTTMIIDSANISNYVCLRQALPFSGAVIRVNGIIFNQGGIVNTSNLEIAQELIVNVINVASRKVQAEISGIYITNNSISALIDGVSSRLLINPDGGNVGLAMRTHDISQVIFDAQTGTASQADGLQFTQSALLNGGVEPPDFNTYYEEQIQIDFDGPWGGGTSQFSNVILLYSRFQDVVTLTMTQDMIRNCSGIADKVRTLTAINSLYRPPFTADATIRVIDSGTQVTGVAKIYATGFIEIGSTRMVSGANVLYGERTQNCGVYQFSVSWLA
jgi:hypothetical protein